MKGMLIKLISMAIVLPFAWGLQAQDFHFIYIQTESQVPFYVKLNNRVISSSAGGYVIIPALTPAIYRITVGSSENHKAAFTFQADVKETDAGYIIKADKDQEWYLANLLTMEQVQTEKAALQSEWREPVKQADEFAKILAEVVNDPSLNMMKLSTALGQTNAKKMEPGITRIEQMKTKEGFFSAYLDGSDTVRVFMPIPPVTTTVPAALQPNSDSSASNKVRPDTLKGMNGYNNKLEKSITPQWLIETVKYKLIASYKLLSVFKSKQEAARSEASRQHKALSTEAQFNSNKDNFIVSILTHLIAAVKFESHRLSSFNKSIFTS